ncbi:unnamed protein product [Lactuca saligna]|uniref:Uncharacterized protein n=1 Tax=Lactuca saligna TaxID=75948 RepID=A0AA35Y6B7_LACSI|nr:unnamed protein product [Lactuca saligna]
MTSFLEQLRCLKIISNDTTQLARTVRERFKKFPLNNPMFWTVWLRMNQDKCKEQVIVDEPRTLKLFNAVISDFNSQDTIGFKDSASFVVDNTPISTFPSTISMSPSTNHDTTSLLSPTTNVKCKLVDVYDLEDTVCESSIKPSKKSIGIKESVVSTQLLIPKAEK